MTPWRCQTAIFTFIACQFLCLAQPAGTPDFQLREMDLHYHSGMERPVSMTEWIRYAVADGRKAIALIDHLELYRTTPAEYAAWRRKGQFEAMYPLGGAGHKAVMASFDEAARHHKGLVILKAWEVFEGELDTGLEMDALQLADFIGWHISPNNRGGPPPDGASLIRRARQLKELRKRLPAPMVLLHPFPMRIEHLQRKARAAGRDLSSLSVAEYRFFQPGEQEKLAELLRGESIYIEISRDTEKYWHDPVVRQALTEDTRPLAELGVQFTVSTDAHGVRDATRPFQPDAYCKPFGVTPANSNALVKELLGARKRP